MKLAVVTPRYGLEAVGGAELAARLLAEQLVAHTDWTVEALTTTARDASTWQPFYPPGVDELGGVRVHRFPVEGARSPDFDRATDRALQLGRRATPAQLREWVVQQGPVAPALIDAIRASDADVFAFHPYLYHPTVVGLPLVRERAVLHPAAHDELVIGLPVYEELFATAPAFGYWSDPERRFAERRFRTGGRPALVVGLGVEPAPGTEPGARAAVGLGDRPFLLCLGRVDEGKGTRVLAECFAAYKERHPGPLALVFAGPVVHEPALHPDIVVAGPVDEPVKWGLLRGALALVSPSAFESFSIVLMEAWSVGTAALVNGRCAVTREHAERSGGAFVFRDFAELDVALDKIVGSADLRAALGDAGRAYVERNFRWPEVVHRYATFLARRSSS